MTREPSLPPWAVCYQPDSLSGYMGQSSAARMMACAPMVNGRKDWHHLRLLAGELDYSQRRRLEATAARASRPLAECPCGRMFVARHGRHVYCAPDCPAARDAKHGRDRQYHATHRAVSRATSQRYRDRQRVGRPIDPGAASRRREAKRQWMVAYNRARAEARQRGEAA